MDGTAAHSADRHMSFVVRLWLEPDQGQVRWRGHIRHVQGTDEVYFEDLARMVAFVEERAGVRLPLGIDTH